MQCPKCGFNNPVSAKFCERCANIFYSAPSQPSQGPATSNYEPKIQVMPGQFPPQRSGGYAGDQGSKVVDFPLKKISDLFKGSISFTWAKKWRFVYLNLIPKLIAVVPILVSALIFGIMIFAGNKSGMNIGWVQLIVILLCLLLFLVSVIYATNWSQAGYIYYLNTQEQSKKTILGQTFKKVWGLFWVSLLKSLIVLGGFILFIIPGLIWGIKYGFAPLVFLVEGYKGRRALKRSAELTAGYRWPVFKRVILFSYIQIIIQIVFAIVFLLVNLFGSLGPAFTILSFVLYIPLILINILIGLLIEPLGYVYDFDIYNNLIESKKKNALNKESYNFGQKLWSVVLMFLLPLIVLVIGLLSSVSNTEGLFIKNLNKVLPEDFKIQESEMESKQNVGLFGALENAKAKERDAKRFADIKKMQTALDLYFLDHNNYPVAANPVVLGEGDYYCFDDQKGFGKQESCQDPLSALFPKNPEPGGINYTYQSTDGKSYRINFSLEIGVDTLSAGEHFATPAGIDQEDVVQDLSLIDNDNDGLTNNDEINIWHTDPNNPDTDGDGYKDGDEVKNGYDPLVPGSARIESKTNNDQFILNDFDNCKVNKESVRADEMILVGINGISYSIIYECPNDGRVSITIFDAGNNEDITILTEKTVKHLEYIPFKNNKDVFVNPLVPVNFWWGSEKYLITIAGIKTNKDTVESIVSAYIMKHPPTKLP